VLHYETSGDTSKPTVLFLHGFMGDLRDWDEIVPDFEQVAHCVRVDLPGHGGSLSNDLDFTMLWTATALVELLDDLGINTFSVVGYSMGGRLALYMAVMFAMRVDVAVVESGSPGIALETERAQRRERDEALARRLETEDFDPFLRDWYAQPLFDTLRKDPDRFAPLLARRRENDPHGLAHSLRGVGTGAQPSLWDDLATITLPLHLVVGEHDAKFSGIANGIAARTKTARIHVIADAGHNVHFEKPREYTELLRQILFNS
jgi:2-succinyl-6-hydroxy-2,4-cyclohexadiene-1-carboxylate synthase